MGSLMRLLKRAEPTSLGSTERSIQEAPKAQPPTRTRIGGSQNISSWLPEGLIRSIDKRVAAGGYRSRSEYVLAACRHYEEHLERRSKRG